MNNMTIDRDEQETVLQSSHREWCEDREREQQERDERAVAGSGVDVKPKASLASQSTIDTGT
jgi:hypothetical protein